MTEVEPWDRVVALAKVSLANPVAAAVLRLHHDEYGSCSECTGESAQSWPCRTVLAIEDAAKPVTLHQMLMAMASRAQPQTFEPATDTEESADGTA